MGIIEKQSVQDIANAIRNRNGLTTLYKPREMDEAILNLYSTTKVNSMLDYILPCYEKEATDYTIKYADSDRPGSISELQGNTTQNGTPTPTNPIPIYTVSGDNEVTVNGSNFLDIEKIKTQTWTNNVYRGTRLNDINSRGTWCFKAQLKEGKTAISGLYVAIAQTINPNASTNALSIKNGVTQASTKTFTGTDLYISFYPTSHTIEEITEVYDLWISKSDTTYEPYTGNSYRVDFGDIELCKIGNYVDKLKRAEGKNLFDNSLIQIGKAWNNDSNTARAIIIISAMPNTKYTISFNSISGLEGVYCFGRTNENDNTRTFGNLDITGTRTITTTADTNYIGLQFNKTSITTTDIEKCLFQIEQRRYGYNLRTLWK